MADKKKQFTNESDPFNLDTTDVYGDIWKGEFTFKIKLSGGDLIRRGQLRRQYLGDNAAAATQEELALAEVYSQLDVRTVKAPSWWKETQGKNIPFDAAVALYNFAMKVEDDYVKRFGAKATEAQTKLRADKEEDDRKNEEAEG